MIFSVALVVSGLVGCVWVLTGQGLDRAEKWVSLVGVFLSVALGTVGTILAWVAWRHGRREAPPATTASGESSVAIGVFNSGKISTQASGPAGDRRAAAKPPGGIAASGPSAVAIGGANTGDITTRFDAAPGESGGVAPRQDGDD